MITTRPAKTSDAAAMTEILNKIIEDGGTTAHQRPFDPDRMQEHYIIPSELICCTVAELGGHIVGFQSLVWPDERENSFADGWTIIATFVRSGMAGRGVGSSLFRATRAAAVLAEVLTIDATIRADNTGGLAYYTKLGFRDYDRSAQVPLGDGTRVDRIRKSYDLN